jgi:tetratricopeptide (TPR) repeat protein
MTTMPPIRTSTALVLACALACPVRAQEPSWLGKTILTKKAGIMIGHTDKQTGKEVDDAELTHTDYKVIAEQGKFIKVRHNGIEGWFDKADAVLLEDAVEHYTARIRENEKDSHAYAQRAYAWQLKGELDIAIKDHSEAIRLDPTVVSYWNTRGTALRDKKDYDRAIKDFDEAIRLDPKYTFAFRNRGTAWQAKQEYDRAIKDYDEAIRLDPKLAFIFYDRGTAWQAKQEYDRAIKDYDQVIRLDPKFAFAFNARGLAWSAKKDYDRAIKDFDEAIRLDPKYPVAFVNRGDSWQDKKDYDRAIKDFDEAIRLDPKLPFIFYHRGTAWQAKQEYARAIKDYDEATRLAPEDPLGFNGAAWLRATCPEAKYRDGTKAVELARKACELTEWKTMYCLGTLAAAYAEAGQFDEAVRWQEKALADKEYEQRYGEAARKRLELYRDKKPYRDE